MTVTEFINDKLMTANSEYLGDWFIIAACVLHNHPCLTVGLEDGHFRFDGKGAIDKPCGLRPAMWVKA